MNAPTIEVSPEHKLLNRIRPELADCEAAVRQLSPNCDANRVKNLALELHQACMRYRLTHGLRTGATVSRLTKELSKFEKHLLLARESLTQIGRFQEQHLAIEGARVRYADDVQRQIGERVQTFFDRAEFDDFCPIGPWETLTAMISAARDERENKLAVPAKRGSAAIKANPIRLQFVESLAKIAIAAGKQPKKWPGKNAKRPTCNDVRDEFLDFVHKAFELSGVVMKRKNGHEKLSAKALYDLLRPLLSDENRAINGGSTDL